MDQHGCGENDPNGPSFDPVHGVFHHFYQIHLAAPPGHGPDYGHFVSKDFVHWAPLPVAIWNVEMVGNMTMQWTCSRGTLISWKKEPWSRYSRFLAEIALSLSWGRVSHQALVRYSSGIILPRPILQL